MRGKGYVVSRSSSLIVHPTFDTLASLLPRVVPVYDVTCPQEICETLYVCLTIQMPREIKDDI